MPSETFSSPTASTSAADAARSKDVREININKQTKAIPGFLAMNEFPFWA
jgi:hypothetical protein